VLAATIIIAWWIIRTPSSAVVVDTIHPTTQEQAPILNPSIEQHASDLVTANTPEAFQVLIQSFKEGQSASQHSIVLNALQGASPMIVPMLITALDDKDAGVRTGAAQVLGLRREHQAIGALTAATHDPNASVRREAVTSLGKIDAWQVLPRLEQLAVNEPDDTVRQAAIVSKESFKKDIAQAIGILTPELRDVSVTTGAVPQIYAVTTSSLYARQGTEWTLVSRLPDVPLSIATGNDTHLIYLATFSEGLYRSLDGGQTWDHLAFGLETPTRLTVTAIAVDPQNPHVVYVALTWPGAEPGITVPLGLGVSQDGGTTWQYLENSPMNISVTRLVMDPQLPGYLFGFTTGTPWRYVLPATDSNVMGPINNRPAPE
jgi:hypothetical protein